MKNLKLADKCFYKVDFLVMLKSGQLECHEIKGFLTDDSLVKFKVAGQKFPFVFRMIALKKGVWVEKCYIVTGKGNFCPATLNFTRL